MMAFKILPVNPNDDYDFLLYKWTDSNFCTNLLKNNITPVRSNISRSGRGKSPITGLSSTATSEYTSAGIGYLFSKSIGVKRGERYYLVLDNVYPEGDGHTIEIGYEKEVFINGKVINENEEPVKSAEVTLEDNKGNEVYKTTTSQTGEYQINTYIYASKSYNLVFIDDSSFIDVKEITSDTLKSNNYKINNIKTILPKLKGGKKYSLNGLNFYGDLAILIPQSQSSLTALYKLMKKIKT
jgi:hypothetical protein